MTPCVEPPSRYFFPVSGDVSFDGLLAVAIVAGVIPIILGFFPRAR